MAFSRCVAAVGVIDENDPAIGQCEPGGVTVIGVFERQYSILIERFIRTRGLYYDT